MGKSKWRALCSRHYRAPCKTESAAALLADPWEEIGGSVVAAGPGYRKDGRYHRAVSDGDNEFILIVGSEEGWEENLDDF
jgi:hypothetical protein